MNSENQAVDVLVQGILTLSSGQIAIGVLSIVNMGLLVYLVFLVRKMNCSRP